MVPSASAVSFYQVLTTISFTLLGLWFTVLGLGPQHWRESQDAHRRTRHVAMHFFLPGLMGLVSVLSGGTGPIWRIAFVVGGLIGVAESVALLLSGRRFRTRATPLLGVLDPVLYALVVVAALLPTPVLGLLPLQIEGIVVGALFVVGLLYLWSSFTDGVVTPTIPEAPPSPPLTRGPFGPPPPARSEPAARRPIPGRPEPR